MGGASEVAPTLIDGVAEVFGAEVYNLYGQTELSSVLTLTRPGDSRDDRLNTVGRPLPHVDCKIIDPDTGEVLPVGVEGRSARAATSSSWSTCMIRTPPPGRSTGRDSCAPAIWAGWTNAAS